MCITDSRRALRRLGFESYDDYLDSRHWADLRARAAAEMTYICVCGASEALQLHHKTYDRIGHEELDDVMWLCEPCHITVHMLERQGLTDLALTGLACTERAAASGAARATTSKRQRAEYDQLHRRDDLRRKARSLARRLRQEADAAIKAGIDVIPDLKWIEAEIKLLERNRDAGTTAAGSS
jgi:hypothetical protein